MRGMLPLNIKGNILMTEKNLIKAMKGIFLFVAFLIMGISIPDANLTTMSYIQELGINPRLFQFLFVLSGIVNLFIGLRGYKWNGLWMATWVMYSVASFIGYLSGSGIPLLTVSAYLLLSASLTIDVMEDAELFKYIGTRLWKREVL